MKKLMIAAVVVVLAAFAAPAFAATNPFMDVPASHWAYDAVAQLAARGVVSGYPDGTYKGPQPITRYEIASIIARSLAYVDMDKASKQDVEMMRRLIIEFSDELSALGVRVDGFDARLGALEKDLGGWKLAGVFEFNMKFGEDRLTRNDAGNYIWEDDGFGHLLGQPNYIPSRNHSDFDVDKYRIFIERQINDTTRFYGRFGKAGPGGHSNDEAFVRWDYYYITTKLGYDIELTAGRFVWDWEDQYGLRTDDDSLMGDRTLQGLGVKKDWGIANLALRVVRVNDNAGNYNVTSTDLYYPQWGERKVSSGDLRAWPSQVEFYRVEANINANFSDKFSGGLLGYFDIADEGDWSKNTFGIYAKFKFHPSVELKGLYYFQSLGDAYSRPGYKTGAKPDKVEGFSDNPKAWRAILDINQDLLKFTSLWLEYGQMDNTFVFDNLPYKSLDRGPVAAVNPHYLATHGDFGNLAKGTAKMLLVKAAQKWNDKWDSWLRYNWVDWDTAGYDDFKQFGIGIGYQLNPAVHFELAYDHADWGPNDDLVRFQTVVNF